MSDWYEPNQWYPTPELRFVYGLEYIDGHVAKKVKILQQQWKCHNYDEGKIEKEWRDVPLLEEGDE